MWRTQHGRHRIYLDGFGEEAEDELVPGVGVPAVGRLGVGLEVLGELGHGVVPHGGDVGVEGGAEREQGLQDVEAQPTPAQRHRQHHHQPRNDLRRLRQIHQSLLHTQSHTKYTVSAPKSLTHTHTHTLWGDQRTSKSMM
jgi:hypothetical protein